MQNLHEHFNSISESDLDPNKTFTPIKILILLDDKKWELFLEDKSLEKLAKIEAFFAINEMFPNGIPVFKEELGKFFAELDTLQVTFSFLNSLSKNKKISNMLEDFRMSIQDFMFSMSIKSYYSAFQQFRKMLEGILWMNHFNSFDEDLPDSITMNRYAELLDAINPKYSALYKKLNKLFHYSKDKTPYFNINRVYQPKDWLMELLQDITDLSDDFIIDANLFLKNIDNIQVKRYSFILEILAEARDSYNLTNWAISKTDDVVLHSTTQETFSELLLADKKSKKKISLLSHEYENGLNYLLYNGFENHNSLRNKNFKRQYLYLNNELFQKCIKITKELFIYEMYESGDFNVSFLKSVLEDVILNHSIHKGINFMLLFLIKDFLKRTHNIETPSLSAFSKYKHLILNKRQMYGGSENRNTGEKNLFPEYKKVLNQLLDIITEAYKIKSRV